MTLAFAYPNTALLTIVNLLIVARRFFSLFFGFSRFIFSFLFYLFFLLSFIIYIVHKIKNNLFNVIFFKKAEINFYSTLLNNVWFVLNILISAIIKIGKKLSFLIFSYSILVGVRLFIY